MRTFLLAVLAIAAIVLVFVGLRGDAPTSTPTPQTHVHVPQPRPAAAATPASDDHVAREVDRDHPGHAVYTRRGCNVCHGVDLGGTNMAPALVDLRTHWNEESFALYLADPDSVLRTDARLQELDARYGMFVMPSYELEKDELTALTAFVLGPER